MNNEMTLPSDYIPFAKLTLCSNVLINVKIPIRIKGQFPLLVGSGEEVPLIWLSATRDGQKWEPVVERNIAINTNFPVIFLNDGKSVLVMLGNIVIVQARKISDTEAEVSILDLRPVGMDVRGKSSVLQAGGNAFTGNVFQNAYAMIDVG